MVCRQVLVGRTCFFQASKRHSNKIHSQGISTSAGIPDFRSPETGLYSNLVRFGLPYPQAVFELDFFKRNPVPFYTLARELYPGRFRPTLAHCFIRLLDDKGLLLRYFTQNCDGLERRTGLPDDKIVEAHGSFATQRCIGCRSPYDRDRLKAHIKKGTIPRCENCQGLVKPDITFAGESLPSLFVDSTKLLRGADLLIVMGTSLKVRHFAKLTTLVGDRCPRVLINLELVGDFNRGDDLVFLGKCDDIVKDLCKELELEKELEGLWNATQYDAEIWKDILEELREAPTARN
ncbi:NAD-dependent protein deacetylase hst2-1 [Leucoagaricus sp. SymC.cos]|nr:NAD-dependent protein deacetylase hst2-1 [Leucoagaricus sp. SymC.cos]